MSCPYCNCCQRNIENYSYFQPNYDSQYYDRYNYCEPYRLHIHKPHIGHAFKGLEHVGEEIKKGAEHVGEEIKKGAEDAIHDLGKINPKEIIEKILNGLEKAIETFFFDGEDVFKEFESILPKNGVLYIPQDLASKILIKIVEKLAGMLFGPETMIIIKEIFPKEIWPHIKDEAFRLLNKVLDKIKIHGNKLQIETFYYFPENYYYNNIYSNENYQPCYYRC